ncbi:MULTISPECIES: TPR end-of-group domain-containing protein, partial [Aerosakkonema]|uniref:TPR end-of-group domain-containing protein n=1 Tax=Aerosakkonema TaxID=1246629 RepID=UPI0035B8B254
AIASYARALAIKPDFDLAWNNRGVALANLGRYEEAIASYARALAIKPEPYQAWYNKAICYALQGDVNKSIENLQKAIDLNPEWREDAKTDSNFDRIRDDKRFHQLIQNL